MSNSYYKNIPKIELHAHLSGSLSDRTITELLKSTENNSKEFLLEKHKFIVNQGSGRSLKECFEVFKIIHLLTSSLQSVKVITEHVIEEFLQDNVCYLEIRTTPKSVANSYSKREYLETVLEVIKTKEESSGTSIRLLISLDRGRGIDDAKENFLLAKEYQSHEKYCYYVCGIDISGNPSSDSLVRYVSILEEAKAVGLNVSAHVLEIETETAFQEAKELIKRGLIDRIGHGTFLHPNSGGSEELTRIVKEQKIPIEICISSNVKCGTTSKFEDHHVKFWKADNHPIVICTDDKGVFSTSLGEELAHYIKIIDGDVNDLKDVLLTAVESAFLNKENKELLRNIILNHPFQALESIQ